MTEDNTKVVWNPASIKCTCGHLATEEVHPYKSIVDETTAIIGYTRPCAVQICECKDLVVDPTGKAKPR